MNRDNAFFTAITGPMDFQKACLEQFNNQYSNNAIYREFCDHLGVFPQGVDQIEKIPFLPIEMFKYHKVLTAQSEHLLEFHSSGTTQSERSIHYVCSPETYTESFIRTFEQFYGRPEDYCFLALLPSYMEQKNSSLVYMVSEFISRSKDPRSGFYHQKTENLKSILANQNSEDPKVFLIGVSYALLDFAQDFSGKLLNGIVMETGGMKGRRKEMIREALHHDLKIGFGVSEIHSEYGMTELFSQAYAKSNGRFYTPPWMQVLIRDTEDPMSYMGNESTGGINIIDLANHDSCCFLATQDLGKRFKDGSFEVLGRFDHSDIRGCNLMAL